MSDSSTLTVTLARLDARAAEIERLLRGSFPTGLLGDSAKLALLEEKIQVVGAKLDLTMQYADNREVTVTATQATLQTLKNERALIAVWLAWRMFLDAAYVKGLQDRDAQLGVLITRTNTLLKYMLERTPTPAARAALPSAIDAPQGMSLAELDALQQKQDIKTLGAIAAVAGVGYFLYRRGVWKF